MLPCPVQVTHPAAGNWVGWNGSDSSQTAHISNFCPTGARYCRPRTRRSTVIFALTPQVETVRAYIASETHKKLPKLIAFGTHFFFPRPLCVRDALQKLFWVVRFARRLLNFVCSTLYNIPPSAVMLCQLQSNVSFICTWRYCDQEVRTNIKYRFYLD